MRFWALIFGCMFGILIFAWGWSLGFPLAVPVCALGALMASPLLIGAFSGG